MSKRTLVFLVGYSCAGKTTALKWVRGAYPQAFCFDVGEVARDRVKTRRRALREWRDISLEKDRREGFEWMFRHAQKWNRSTRPKQAPLVVVSGNRITRIQTAQGSMDFIKETMAYFSVRRVRILSIQTPVRERFLRKRRRDSAWRHRSLADFKSQDLQDARLGLKQLIRQAHLTVLNRSDKERFKGRLLRALDRTLDG